MRCPARPRDGELPDPPGTHRGGGAKDTGRRARRRQGRGHAGGEGHRERGVAVERALFAAVEKLTAKFWPGVAVLPTMSAGATDGRFLRNAGIPTYGHSGLASDIFDVRWHGKDERVNIKAFYDGQQYLYELVKLLAGGR